MPKLLRLPVNLTHRLINEAKTEGRIKSIGTEIPFGSDNVHVGISYDPGKDLLTVDRS
ncbi:MAG: hypothetical protein AAB449_02750 [Patescibacteria group bacterium]